MHGFYDLLLIILKLIEIHTYPTSKNVLKVKNISYLFLLLVLYYFYPFKTIFFLISLSTF